jgi:hypothetical protein
MELSEYMMIICIGIAATILGILLLLVEVTAYGAVATGLGALVSLSGIVGAFWNS